MEYRWPAPSRAVRSRGRASHEDCCAAARDPTGIGRAGSEPPGRASPSLRNLAVPRGAEQSGARVSGRPRRATAERARIQLARARERERLVSEEIRKEKKRERETEWERKRVGGKETKRRERERAPPPPPSGLPCVRPSVCSDQEDGLTGPSVWPFDTRCVDRLADDEL